MKRAFLGALALAAASASVQAAELSIQFTGLDLVYDNGTNGALTTDGTIRDAGTDAGRDPLTSMVISLDGVIVGTFNSNIFADISINGLNEMLSVGGPQFSNTTGFFNIYVPPSGLFLSITNPVVAVTINALGVTTTFAGGESTLITSQALPFGITALTPVDFSYSAQIANVTTYTGLFGVQGLNSFTASGTGEVTSQAVVPAPAALGLLGIGVLAMGLAGRAKRKAT